MIRMSQEKVRSILGLVRKESKITIYLRITLGLCVFFIILWLCCSGDETVHLHLRRDNVFDSSNTLSENLRWIASHSAMNRHFSNQVIGDRKVHVSEKHSLSFQVKPQSKEGLSPSREKAAMEIFSKDDNQKSKSDLSNYLMIAHASSSYLLVAGELIQATIESAVNTDFSGPVRAVVSKPVYSYQGDQILIPSGSRLLGDYQKVMHHAQSRIWIKWDRVILPNGNSVRLDSPSIDTLGKTGSKADEVNHHAWIRFKEATLLSLLSGGTMLADGFNASTETAGQEFRSNIANHLGDAAEESWSSQRNIPSTASLYPGHRVMVYVMHDINFQDVMEESHEH